MSTSSVQRPLRRALLLAVLLGSLQCSENSDIGPGEILAIHMVPGSLVLDIGQEFAVRAFPVDADSAFIASRHVSWSSDQPAIVVVDDTGGVSGQALGTATITAEAGGVSGSTFITVSPPEIGFGGLDTARFAAIQLDPDPADLDVPVRTLRFVEIDGLAVGTITYGAGGSGWLQVTLNQGTTPTTLTLSPSTTGLGAGTYRATVPLTATTPGTPPAALDVELTLGAGPTIALSPATADLFAVPGGADPAPVTLQVTNAGGGTLAGLAVGTITYGAGASGWITSATLNQATAPATLTISAQVGPLAGGTYTATIPITSTSAVNSPLAAGATFTVTNQATIQLSAPPPTLIANHLGGNPTPAAVQITNGTSGTLANLSVNVSYGPGATGWLNQSLNSTTAPATLTLSPVTGTLGVGTFNATVSVSSPLALNSPESFPVSLQVRTSFAIDVQPVLSTINCSGCHGFFTIPEPWPHNLLVGNPACPSFPNDSVWVFPGNPNRSYLYRVLTAQVDPGCQSIDFQPMPPGGLAPAPLGIIRQWILDGALNN